MKKRFNYQVNVRDLENKLVSEFWGETLEEANEWIEEANKYAEEVHTKLDEFKTQLLLEKYREQTKSN